MPDALIFGDSLEALAAELYRREIQSFLLECGPDLAFNALQSGIIDKIVVFVAPKILGGREIPAIGGDGIEALAEAIRLRDWTVDQCRDRISSSQRMFTGIIEEVGRSRRIDDTADFRHDSGRGSSIFDDLQIGSSIAVNGVCLTARSVDAKTFTAELSRETLDRTSLGSLAPGLDRQSRTSDARRCAFRRPHCSGPRGRRRAHRATSNANGDAWNLRSRVSRISAHAISSKKARSPWTASA